MKISILLLFINSSAAIAQDTTKKDTSTYIVLMNSGKEYIGKILKNDSREVILFTNKLGEIAIPKHTIEEIKKADNLKIGYDGNFIEDDVFSTRYFFTTNTLPIKKGENYVRWNLYGPDVEFGIAKNLSVGLMTSWLMAPIVANMKYSIPVDKKVNLSIGILAGTGSWFNTLSDERANGILPHAELTIGDRKSNITLSAGYLVTNFVEMPLVSMSAMVKISKKVTFVGEVIAGEAFNTGSDRSGSYIQNLIKITPGFRVTSKRKVAYQFGFTWIGDQTGLFPVPYPVFQVFQKF